MTLACPKCGATSLGVICTRVSKRGFRIRRRVCLRCKHRYYTAQPPEAVIGGSHPSQHPLYPWYSSCASLSTPKPSCSAA